MTHPHQHRKTDLREPRPSKSRTGVSYTAWRDGRYWVEHRVPQKLEALEGQGENAHDDR